MATIYEVSKRAGVCPATVSRVISGNAKVRESTKARVHRAMDELGFQPNAIAQSLASKRTNSIGLLISELHGSFFGKMMSAVETQLREAGKHAIIAAGHGDLEKEKQAIDFLMSRRCDALIIHSEAISDNFIKGLRKKEIPFVVINHNISGLSDRCFYVDNETGAYLATEKAIKSGHQTIAYISGPLHKEDAMQRKEGYLNAMSQAGLKVHKSLIYEGDYLEQGGELGFNKFIKGKQKFTALICANDDMAFGAMRAARFHNIEIPKQLSIIGFDDVLYSRYLFPALTTVNNPVTEMGTMAARWILKNVYKLKTPPIQNQFRPELIERDSLINI